MAAEYFVLFSQQSSFSCTFGDTSDNGTVQRSTVANLGADQKDRGLLRQECSMEKELTSEGVLGQAPEMQRCFHILPRYQDSVSRTKVQ